MAAEDLISVAEARARLLAGAAPLAGETVALADAGGRVLAGDVTAARTQPPFDASAMDGYAVRGADVVSVPTRLAVTGSIAAGVVPARPLAPGEAMRIFTGAPLPQGADTIVIQEDAEPDGADGVIVKEPAATGAFVRRRGLDFTEGDVLLRAGTRLHARHLALAAAMNRTHLPVRRKPRVAILATGDELVPPGTEPGPGQIVSSNNVGIAAFVSGLGGEPLQLGIARDDRAEITAAIRRARDLGADILVTLGGVSVGEHDLVQASLKDEGLKLGFWRIAMRPGKPLMFGALGPMRAIGLPGNPASTMVCAQIFLAPLVGALLGASEPVRTPETALLTAPLGANDRRQDYLRATLALSGGALAVTPAKRQDSSMLGVLANADCLIVRAPHAPALPAGATVEIIRLDVC